MGTILPMSRCGAYPHIVAAVRRLRPDGKTIELARLLAMTGSPGIEATITSAFGDEAKRYAFRSFAAHFCAVRVNRWTGEPHLPRLTIMVDAGRIITEKAARNQIIGEAPFGVGQALFEHAAVESTTGRITNANFADHLIPVNADVPDIDVGFLDYPDPVFTSVGARGIGELGTVGAARCGGQRGRQRHRETNPRSAHHPR